MQGGRYPGGGGAYWNRNSQSTFARVSSLAGLVCPLQATISYFDWFSWSSTEKRDTEKGGPELEMEHHTVFLLEREPGYITVAVSKQDFLAREFKASFLVMVYKALFKSAVEAGNDGIQLLSSTQRTKAQLIVPDWGDKVYSGIELSATLCR